MRTIEKHLIILYFFICPLEMALNIIFGSTTKYVGLLILMVWAMSIINDIELGKTEISTSVVAMIVWLIYCYFSTLWGIRSSYTKEYLTTYLLMGIFLIVCTYQIWEAGEINSFILAYCCGSLLMALLVIFAGSTEFNGRETIRILNRYCDPNQVAANILPGALISFYRLQEEKRTLIQCLSVVCFLFCTFAVLITGSRGGLLGYISSMVTIILVRTVSGKLKIRSLVLLIFFYIVMGVGLPDTTVRRLFEFSSYTEEYAQGGNRLTLWSILLKDFDAQWIVGHGVGSTIITYIRTTGGVHGVHNTFLLVIYEVGVIGFILFIFPYVSELIYHIKRENDVYVALVIGALVCSFFLDALNLRYLWNSLMICIMKRSYDYKLLHKGYKSSSIYIK